MKGGGGIVLIFRYADCLGAVYPMLDNISPEERIYDENGQDYSFVQHFDVAQPGVGCLRRRAG
jgi:hypothetical protein